jgi:hypothetical protein
LFHAMPCRRARLIGHQPMYPPNLGASQVELRREPFPVAGLTGAFLPDA